MERKIRKLWWVPIVTVCAAVILLSPLLIAQAQSEAWAAVMEQGNQRYEAGDYAGAIAKYRMIVDSGVENGQIDYNLGNAYFKNGELGEAILHYERAHQLLPRDKDVTANLQFARSQLIDQVDLPEEPAIVRWVEGIHNLATLNETLWWTWAIYWILTALALLAIFVRRARHGAAYALAVFGALFVLSLVSLGVKIHHAGMAQAIVTAAEANVYSGPGEDYLLQFTVHEGVKFDVEGERQGWYRVRLSGDLEGWAPKDTLEVI